MISGCMDESPKDNEELVQPTMTLSVAETLTPVPSSIMESTSTMVETEIDHSIFDPVKIKIPAGEFDMGADPQVGLEVCREYRRGCSLEDFKDEAPKHAVYLDDYWIMQTEVTNQDYRACVQAEGCSEPFFPEFYHNETYNQHPVVHVDWFSASKFCEWAGGRLPTEAEWEKAALGDTGQIFPWGNEADCEKANYDGCNFEDVTLPVGSYPDGVSIYRVLDMAGNAAEWTADWYDPGYYAVSPIKNPTGPVEGELKTARGGSWKNPGVGIRSANRAGNFPEVFSSGVGFRCVWDGN